MKRVALTIISIVLLGTISSFAQDSIQPIVVKKAFLGNKYFYGDTRILSISDWANSHLKKASLYTMTISVLFPTTRLRLILK